jgi:hypothetical protein
MQAHILLLYYYNNINNNYNNYNYYYYYYYYCYIVVPKGSHIWAPLGSNVGPTPKSNLIAIHGNIPPNYR